MEGSDASLSMINSYFPAKTIQVLCDPNDSGDSTGSGPPQELDSTGVGKLLEVRTCWVPKDKDIPEQSYVMIDCPEASSSSHTVPCPEKITLRSR